MSLQQTTSGERVHIGFYGLRNAGKSSLVNAVTGQALSLVSDVKGTTTDPVKKAMELLPLGPVVIIDTPGMDDEGALGAQRVARAKQMLRQTDIAVLVVDALRGMTEADRELEQLLQKQSIPYLIVYNKSDLADSPIAPTENTLAVSAVTGDGIHELKERLGTLAKTAKKEHPLVADLVQPGDTVILVIPIDEAAPKGRLILPQQQTIRELLETGAISLVTRVTELAQTLATLTEPPRLVITDSQAFGAVSKLVPENILLTSFSILFARYKGDLKTAVEGAAVLNRLQNGDRLLISEGCTHHRQCGDIGSVKLPRWIEQFTQKKPRYQFTSGGEFPENLQDTALVIHCGGCMLNEAEMKSRIRICKEQGVPITNYGIAIAALHGILQRSLGPFPEIAAILQKSKGKC